MSWDAMRRLGGPVLVSMVMLFLGGTRAAADISPAGCNGNGVVSRHVHTEHDHGYPADDHGYLCRERDLRHEPRHRAARGDELRVHQLRIEPEQHEHVAHLCDALAEAGHC